MGFSFAIEINKIFYAFGEDTIFNADREQHCDCVALWTYVKWIIFNDINELGNFFWCKRIIISLHAANVTN